MGNPSKEVSVNLEALWLHVHDKLDINVLFRALKLTVLKLVMLGSLVM